MPEGQVVARLARDGEREAVVHLPENQAVAAPTAGASVRLWSAPAQSHPAVLRELAPGADPVMIRDPGPNVILGMTATVHLTPAGAATGFSLPLSALHRSGDRTAVRVVECSTGKLTLVPVAVREYRHETVVLPDGVKPGQWVVTAGVQKLDPGVTVRGWEDAQ